MPFLPDEAEIDQPTKNMAVLMEVTEFIYLFI